MEPKVKIFLAIPTYKFIEPETTNTLSRLFERGDFSIEYHNKRGSPNIYLQHHNLYLDFMDGDCTHYLWFDSDQAILEPENWLARLIRANKPIISPLIVKKTYPYFPACINEDERRANHEGRPAPLPDYRHYGDNVFKITYCCGGIVLIKREVLESLENPFYPALDDRGNLMGVDISLYYKAKKKGFTCWIEPTIKAAHLGIYPFIPDDYYSLLDAGIIKEGVNDEKTKV